MTDPALPKEADTLRSSMLDSQPAMRRCNSVVEAKAAFDQHGFCVFASGMPDDTLSAWKEFMQECTDTLATAPRDQ